MPASRYCEALLALPSGHAHSALRAGLMAMNVVPQPLPPGVPESFEPRMDPTHVANAIVYMASLPLESNVLTMTVMATKMPFVGRG